MTDFWKVNQASTKGLPRYWDMIEKILTAGWTTPNAGDGFAESAIQDERTFEGWRYEK